MLLLTYSLLRVVFYVYNRSLFPESGFRPFWGGIRFDLSAIAYLNIPYLAAMLLPFKFAHNKTYRRICNIYFVAANSLALLAACIDIGYFPYVSKRMTADIFSYMGHAQFDFGSLAPLFLKEFWWIAVIWIALVTLLAGSRNSHTTKNHDSASKSRRHTIIPFTFPTTKNVERAFVTDNTENKTVTGKMGQWLCYLLLLFLGLTAMRGGWQYRPLGIIHAGQYATPQYIPLVLNSPFTLIRTIGKKTIEERHDFPDLAAAEQLFSPVHQHYEASALHTAPVRNVVIIILEGISQEMFKFYHSEEPDYPQYCPFLDSIAARSWAWNGIADGRRTMEGVPAIVCGIPTLMEHAFIETPFAMNNLHSPVSLLAEKGYRTLFFHGAENGSMNFESFCKSIGFQQYYGMDEYPRHDDYDGAWGIPDRSFLHFMAETLRKEPRPFFSCVMTLSSHHPFRLPKDAGEQANYPKGTHPMHTVSAYTDLALREFFQILSQESWFDSTLFIITADHAYEGSGSFSQNPYGNYRIPMLFYHPAADTAFFCDDFMQQTDIMPTLFAYLRLQSPMVCFGQNLFDPKSQPMAVNHLSGIYQIYRREHLLQFDGEKVVGFYNLKKDPMVKNNLSAGNPTEAANGNDSTLDSNLLYLKAFLQSYSTRMIHNQLSPSRDE